MWDQEIGSCGFVHEDCSAALAQEGIASADYCRWFVRKVGEKEEGMESRRVYRGREKKAGRDSSF